MGKTAEYELTIDLNTLKHLGIGLYSNIPAVISEVVANSWDADATRVDIDIDTKKRIITIADDGCGMSKTEINDKYLKVGYPKRDKDPTITPKGRHVMGRKGIGKLSLFSIADTIEVHSVKDNGRSRTFEKNGFIMNTDKIEEVIRAGKGPYHPKPVNDKNIKIKKGTTIILSDLKKGVNAVEIFLRKRLARRFSIIGDEYDFSVSVNDIPITIKDRDYFKKIEYIWYFGEESKSYAELCINSRKQMKIDGIVDRENEYRITGWVGTFDEQKSIEEGNNTIVILAWGKLIHEDVLKDLKEGGVFSKYLIGEIRADFLDVDNKEDIVTSDRQSLKESDPRFGKLRKYVQDEVLKVIQSKWRDWRNENAEKKALENPTIKKWFDQLGPDNKKYARILFSKIESIPVPDPEYKKELYKHGILAFESLALKDNLSALNNIGDSADFDLIKSIFTSMDELEAVHYWQITRNRVEILKKFENIVPTAQEKLIQEYIFDHLWLLDSSWERASTDAKMEETIYKEWRKLDVKLNAEEKSGRIDIRYRTAAGKHIIIELKKYDKKIKATQIVDQIRKYRSALEKCLKKSYPEDEHIIEVICILGSPPEPSGQDKENREILRAVGARYITYDQLIRQTTDSYKDYLDKQKEINRVQVLIDSL
jgi:hypothetical protein